MARVDKLGDSEGKGEERIAFVEMFFGDAIQYGVLDWDAHAAWGECSASGDGQGLS